MPVRPLILSPPTVMRALRDDPADLLVRAGGGQRWRALRALPALRALFSMTQLDCSVRAQGDGARRHNYVIADAGRLGSAVAGFSHLPGRAGF